MAVLDRGLPGQAGDDRRDGDGSQLYDAVLTLDTGAAVALPPLVSWAWLQHAWSRTLSADCAEPARWGVVRGMRPEAGP